MELTSALGAQIAYFEAIERAAEKSARDGRYDSALAWSRLASSYATSRSVGRLCSPILEEVSDRVARTLPVAEPRDRHNGRRVLHVLSEASHLGGHTKTAVRWIQLDTASVSSLVMTRSHVIEELERAIGVAGGTATSLFPNPPTRRAALLRKAASEADVVVCHIHPDDPVPGAAFGTGYRGAPVIFVNHADHGYWLSSGPGSLVANMRTTRVEQEGTLRALPSEQVAHIPIPLPLSAYNSQLQGRLANRVALGLPTEPVIIMTLARAPKYSSTAIQPTFEQIAHFILADNPGLVLLAVGPGPDDEPWPKLRYRFEGRVVVPGPSEDPELYLRVSDLYLDSYPFSSNTSMLEAAVCGLPIVSLSHGPGLPQLLSSGVLPASSIRSPSLKDLLSSVNALASDPGLRTKLGQAARDEAWQAHGDGVWRDRVEELYQQASQVKVRSFPRSTPRMSADEQYWGLLDKALPAVEQRPPVSWLFYRTLADFSEMDGRRLAKHLWLARAEEALGRRFLADPRDASLISLPLGLEAASRQRLHRIMSRLNYCSTASS